MFINIKKAMQQQGTLTEATHAVFALACFLGDLSTAMFLPVLTVSGEICAFVALHALLLLWGCEVKVVVVV